MRRRPEPPPPCTNEADHTPGQPAGYLAWHEWAEEMSKTHKQKRCPGCRLLQIWVPKNTTAAAREDTDHDTR